MVGHGHTSSWMTPRPTLPLSSIIIQIAAIACELLKAADKSIGQRIGIGWVASNIMQFCLVLRPYLPFDAGVSSLLATGSDTGTIDLWHVKRSGADWQLSQQQQSCAHDNIVSCLTTMQLNSAFASGSWDGSACIWRIDKVHGRPGGALHFCLDFAYITRAFTSS